MTSKLPLPRKLSTHTSHSTPARKASGISVSKAASKPNFLNKQPQVVNDMGEERTVVYVGNDPISGVQLYAFKDPDGHLDGGDPRGMLGRHATDWLVAKEYNMEGPDVAFSWMTLNDNKDAYDKAMAYAKRKWTGGAEKAARPSFRKRYALGVRKSDVDPAVEKAGDAADRAGYNTRMSAKGLTIMGCKVEDAKKALGGLASKFSLKQDGNNVAATLNVAAAARAGMSKAGGYIQPPASIPALKWTGDEDNGYEAKITLRFSEERSYVAEVKPETDQFEATVTEVGNRWETEKFDTPEEAKEWCADEIWRMEVEHVEQENDGDEYEASARPAMHKAGTRKIAENYTASDVAATLNVAAAARPAMRKLNFQGVAGQEQGEATYAGVRFQYEVEAPHKSQHSGGDEDWYGAHILATDQVSGKHMGEADHSGFKSVDDAKTWIASMIDKYDRKRRKFINLAARADTFKAERPEMRKLSLNDQRLVAKMVADMKKAKRHYAWDKCVADAKKNGADDPEAVCASIARGSGLKNKVKGKAAQPIVLKSLSELKRIAIVEPDPRIRAGYAEELAKRMTKAGDGDDEFLDDEEGGDDGGGFDSENLSDAELMQDFKANGLGFHENVTFPSEHGQRWAMCGACGASWSVVDTNMGIDFEEVDMGDGTCQDNASARRRSRR